jgi:hypothetical protein
MDGTWHEIVGKRTRSDVTGPAEEIILGSHSPKVSVPMAFAVHRRGPLAALCLCLVALAHPVSAQDAVPAAGRVKAASGSATIVRSGQSSPAAVGAVVSESDVLRTGSDGQLAVMLKDESRLSMGPNSEITLATFTYVPAESRLALVVRMARGALSYVSGRIAKLMPDAVRLETPTSVIGVRGTHALIHVGAP